MTQSRSRHPVSPDRLRAALRQAVPAMLLRAGSAASPEPLQVQRAPAPTAPAQMAAAQSTDAATRAELQALYARCLHTYRNAIRPQDTDHDDAGAAMALFVATCLHALNGTDATPQMIDTLERQLRGVVQHSADWHGAPVAQRQVFFERTAILGVLMAGHHGKARSEGAGALAEVRRVARAYLRQLLGFDPDALTIGASGLRVQPR